MSLLIKKPMTRKTLKKHQAGFSIVIAIFILVVLSLLGAAMINLTSTGADSVAREVISTRALMAANSGAERMLSSIFNPGGVVLPGNCTVGNNYGAMGLLGCSNVVVDCNSVNVNGIDYFTITSTGICGPNGDEAHRVVEVQAKDS